MQKMQKDRIFGGSFLLLQKEDLRESKKNVETLAKKYKQSDFEEREKQDGRE